MALQPDSELDPELASVVRKASDEDIAGNRQVQSPSMLALFRGGLLYALDALDAAHTFFQDDSSRYGSYWHGMMHRREGDFSNACYWFSRAGMLPEALKIQELLKDPLLGFAHPWSPEDFTRRCERLARSRPDTPLQTLQAIQKIEFSVLLRRCWDTAVGPLSSS